MTTFKDERNQEWEVTLDAPKINKIRSDCDPQFLLNDGEKENTYSRLLEDPVLLCRVIFLLCSRQRLELGVSEEDFYMAVIGDSIDRATEALLGAIVSFIPERARTLLEVFAEQDKLQQRAIRKAAGKINDPALRDEVMAQVEAKIEEEFSQVLTRLQSATSTPASSESSPAA